jgi:hypothetical protein
VEAALAEPRCFPLKKKNRTASPHPKTALLLMRKEALLPTALLWLVKFVPQNGKLARSLNAKKNDEPMQSHSASIC